MRILKKILLFVVAIIALLLIVGLFAKKDYAVEREIVINKPKAEVFAYVKMVKNQDYFSVWNKKDPNIQKEFKGTDGEVGFVYAWKSENKEVGVGEQEIVKIDEGKRVEFKLRFKEPFVAEDDGYFITEELSPTQTKVKWGFTGTMKYPMNLMLLMMDMEKEIGGAMQTGLNDLKAILEK